MLVITFKAQAAYQQCGSFGFQQVESFRTHAIHTNSKSRNIPPFCSITGTKETQKKRFHFSDRNRVTNTHLKHKLHSW